MRYESLPALFMGICDAIRKKDGTSVPISHQDIPTRIEQIGGGGGDGAIIFTPVQTAVMRFKFFNVDDVKEEEVIWKQEL